MRLLALALSLIPAATIADGHIEIGVQCNGPAAVAIAVRMTRPDVALIPLGLVNQFCAQQHDDDEGKPS